MTEGKRIDRVNLYIGVKADDVFALWNATLEYHSRKDDKSWYVVGGTASDAGGVAVAETLEKLRRPCDVLL